MEDDTLAARVRELIPKHIRLAITADGDGPEETISKLVTAFEFGLAALQQRLAEVERERDEARTIVANVNNSVLGSQGYFTTPSCVDAVEDLKASNRALRREVAALRQEKDSAYKQGVEDAHRCQQRHAHIDALEAEVTRLREALEPLTELRITADQIEGALKRLGHIALRDEAYVKVATETLVRVLRNYEQALRQAGRGEAPTGEVDI